MIEINNLTTNPVAEDLIKKAAGLVILGEKGGEGKSLSIALIGSGRMRKLNKRYRRQNRTTDVLAFPEAEVPFSRFSIDSLRKTEDLGEVVICLGEVKKSFKRFNVPFAQELVRVLIHGILHLLGYDHEKSEAEAKQMKQKEEYYLRKLNAQI